MLTEVGDRVWTATYAGVTTAVLGGADGLLVVDPAGGAELVADVRTLGAPVVGAVLTHGHVTHTRGLDPLREAWPSLVAHAHENAGARADRTLSSVGFVELGDRVVELLHPGRGHTAGDLVVRVPDADVVLAGDLVSGEGSPRYGEDCFPLEWPAAFDVLIGLLTARSVVVPGHGPVLVKERAEEQRQDIAVVAQMVADRAAPSVTVDDVLGDAAWPFPVETLRLAVSRALEQLPRSARQLPLL